MILYFLGFIKMFRIENVYLMVVEQMNINKIIENILEKRENIIGVFYIYNFRI